MERLSEREKERIGELVAEGSPAWVIHQEISRSRWAIRRYVNSLERPSLPVSECNANAPTPNSSLCPVVCVP